MESDFFHRFNKRRQLKSQTESSDEAEKYLADTASEIASLNNYSDVRKLYIKLNTAPPSSSSVKRVFSFCGRVFSPLRSNLSSEHMEMMVFLKEVK